MVSQTICGVVPVCPSGRERDSWILHLFSRLLCTIIKNKMICV